MYRLHEQRVLAYALRRAPLEVAKDAVADAFLAAWRRFEELPRDPLPWLLAATRKTLANQRRSAVRQEHVVGRVKDAYGVTPLQRDEPNDGATVLAALARLDDSDREALTLIAWDGLTPAEAARVLDCSASAFRVRLHRARRRFASALRDVDPTASRAAGVSSPAPHVEELA